MQDVVQVLQSVLPLSTASLTCRSLRLSTLAGTHVVHAAFQRHLQNTAAPSARQQGKFGATAPSGRHIVGRPQLAQALPRADITADSAIQQRLIVATRSGDAKLCLQLYEQLTAPALLPGPVVDSLLKRTVHAVGSTHLCTYPHPSVGAQGPIRSRMDDLQGA